jgi:large subunit ribosomal protein L24
LPIKIGKKTYILHDALAPAKPARHWRPIGAGVERLQTTLLGLAIAVILALVTALIGPLLIDWGGYRSVFEAEATRLVGLNVRVTGPIDGRLLPSPRLTLHEIEIGRDGDDKVRARALSFEFALSPLLRGEWRATQMHLTGPQLNVGLDASGHLQTPSLAIGFDPDALSIERLSIEDGRLTLTDAAAGGSITLDHLWFKGEARSLLGPVKGEGAANVGGDLYPYRLAVGRYSDDGRLKIRLTVDPVNFPLSAETDGTLTLAKGRPEFEGTLNLSRPVGIAAGALTQPWRLGGKIKANPSSALMQKVEFQYGSRDKDFKLTGVADFTFGKQPRFDGVLSADQIDLDRASAEGGAPPPPAAAVRQLAQMAGAAFRPKFPIKLGIGIDRVTLGSDTVQNLRGDITSDAGGWNLESFEFRAPGYTQVRLSGHLALDSNQVSFSGPAELKANDPKMLAAWLEGRPAPAQSELRPLSLRGDLTLASDKVAVERLNAEFDRRPIAGTLVYAFAVNDRPARLEAAIKAPDIDIDAALGFGQALLAGSGIAQPRDMTIAADIGHATIAGFDARSISAQVKVDGGGLQIDRLSVADLGGAAFSASGRIATVPSPQGNITVNLDARDMAPVMTLLARVAPKSAELLGRGAPAMAPAKLRAILTVDGAAPATRAKLSIDGSLGKVGVAINGETTTDLVSLGAGNVKLSGKLTADDGKQLLAVLGLDRFAAVDTGAGVLTVDASGPLRGDMQIGAKLEAGGLSANAAGTADIVAGKPSAKLRAEIARANLAPFRSSGGQGSLPVTFSGRIALSGEDLALSDVTATVAGAALRGNLAVTLAAPHGLRGDIDADRIEGASVLAFATGAPAADAKAMGWNWSGEPFAAGLFGDYSGRIKLKARSVDVLPWITAREFSATVNFGNREISADDVTGAVAGGRLTGKLSLVAAGEGLRAGVKFALAGADAAALWPASAKPPVAGTLALSGEADGTGLSPVALIGSLQGSGKFSLTGAQISGLDPRAFDAVTRAVDAGLVVDQFRISDLARKALESGQLAVKHADGDLTVSAGLVRLRKFDADGGAAQLSAAGDFDLASGTVDGRLVLSGAARPGGSRPDIFIALKGPLPTAERTIDVSALSGWLTLRSIENQSKQLRAIENDQPPNLGPSSPSSGPKSEVSPADKPAAAPPPRKTPAVLKPIPKPVPQPVPQNAASAPLRIDPKRAPALPPPVELGTLPVAPRAAQP